MIYKDFKGLKLSALGLGTMRLPTLEGDDSKIDIKAAKEMFDYAIKNGINYFDTAYGYHSGESEVVNGKILSKYPRESYYIASKFPGFSEENMQNKEKIFNEQLKKCQVDYFDFYLFHCLSERSYDYYTSEEYSLMDYLLEQKRAGKIRHIGFSTHASFETTKKFIDKYREHIEFCQIQLNYLDWTLQDAKKFVELLNEYNIPIWVMEPVRGGMLANLGDNFISRLKAQKPDYSVVEWAFRFLQTLDGVTMILSGMSNMEQLISNITTFSKNKPLSDSEFKTILSIADDMLKLNKLPCTACKYCITKCPMGLDIPEYIRKYNNHCITGAGKVPKYLTNGIEKSKLPSACISCKACEQICPQNIKISEMMKDFSSRI